MSEHLCRARIAQNAQTREPTLDLSSLNLTSLPETIGELTHLEALNLACNRPLQLPPELANLTKLRKLDLSFPNQSIIPAWLDQLTSLEELDIRANSTTGIPTVLTRLPRLQKLNLYLDGFEELPSELLNLPMLHNVAIGSSKLTRLPDWFSDLRITALEYYLNSIPNEHLIGAIDSLQVLDLQLYYGKPTAFPAWLRQMHQLRWLCFNGQTPVPPWLIELPRLAYLESNGDFSEISQVWHGWESLEQLECRNVGDTPFPPKLKTLKLSSKATVIPESIRQLTQLEELQFTGDECSEIPDWVLELPQLHTLDLRATYIHHVHPPAQANYSMRNLLMNTFVCRENSHILDGIRNLPMLETLWLSGHTLEHLPPWLPELQHLRELSVIDCRLTKLDMVLGQLQQLETLHLHENSISSESVDASFPQLTNLKELSLYLSDTEQFPKSIRQLHQLRSLYLRIGSQAILPAWLNQLENLEMLWISGPELNYPLPLEAWLDLLKLKELHLSIYPAYPLDPELRQRFEQHGVKVNLG